MGTANRTENDVVDSLRVLEGPADALVMYGVCNVLTYEYCITCLGGLAFIAAFGGPVAWTQLNNWLSLGQISCVRRKHSPMFGTVSQIFSKVFSPEMPLFGLSACAGAGRIES